MDSIDWQDSPLQHWLPVDLSQNLAGVFCKWIYFGSQQFKESFFTDTIAKCLSHPFNSSPFRVSTGIEYLSDLQKLVLPLNPTAFIFHISRCGSTLLSQLLSLDDKNVVVSEGPLFDKILRLKYTQNSIEEDTRLEYLKSAIALTGQKRFENQQRYFVKWDSWHLFFLNDIQKAFPEVPIIFLKRELEEVIQSHKKLPGTQAVPGLLEPAIMGLQDGHIREMGHDLYLEMVLQKMLRAMGEFMSKNGNCLLLDYENGTLENYQKTLDFLKMEIDEGQRRNAQNRLNYHSKHPEEAFKPV